MLANVIQFLLPHGDQRTVQVEIADDLAAKVDEVLKSGCRLTAEVLTTGHVSVCIEDPEHGDFAIAICVNGPSDFTPQQAVEKMLREFSVENLKDWRENVEDDYNDVISIEGDDA